MNKIILDIEHNLKFQLSSTAQNTEDLKEKINKSII